MLRLLASLERLPVERKLEAGEWLLERFRKGSEKTLGWWAIGRIGARQSLYGSAHQVIPAETAGHWLQALLALDWKKVEPAAFAATQIARLTGDRARGPAGRHPPRGSRAPGGNQCQHHLDQAGAERRRTRQGRPTPRFRRIPAAGLKLVPETGNVLRQAAE
jgi:hypothetical protein